MSNWHFAKITQIWSGLIDIYIDWDVKINLFFIETCFFIIEKQLEKKDDKNFMAS